MDRPEADAEGFDPDGWVLPVLDDSFVASAAVREEAGDIRVERASRIAQAHEGAKAQLPPGRYSVPFDRPRPRERRSSSRSARVVTAVVLLAVVAAFVLRPHLPGGGGPSGDTRARSSSLPPPSREEAAHPLGHPPQLVDARSSYRFLYTQPGSSAPVTYDPCRPVHYVVNPTDEPVGAGDSVQAAVAAVAAATGLRFVDDGVTTENFGPRRAAYQPDRYGRRWAPVLIDFSPPTEDPQLTGGVLGVGGSEYANAPDGHRTFVTGAVDIDSVAAGQLVLGSGRLPLSAVIEHELGHVAGLAHVDDVTQLMYPDAGRGVTTYASGDLTGLARLGAGRCAPGL